MSRAIIVDENDNVIGYKTREEMASDDISRITGLWITNGKGEILLAQRAFDKKHDPGKWGPAVAGTVEEGETYESNIIKEADEEIGLKDIKPILGPKFFRETSHKYFVQWFTLIIDAPIEFFKPDPKEVVAVQWISKTKLNALLAEHPEQFLQSMPAAVTLFCK